jgi:hypothetical protein
LELPNDDDYVGREILVNGKPNRVGLNVITYAGTYMTYSYDTYESPGSLGDEEAYIISGDSGGPSFTDVNGIMAVLGTHYWNYGSPPVNGSVSGDSFVPDCIPWLDSQMVGEQVTVVTPEPGTLTLLAAAAACAVAVLVRRARV